MGPYRVVNRREIYNGKIVRMIVDDVELPNGSVAKREIVLLHYEGVGILPVDDEGNVYLVRQYRHALGQHVLEIPAGTMDALEKPEECAARELEEEIGYRASKLTFVMAANNAIGVSNDRIHIYIAEGLTKTAQKLDADEFLTVEKYSLARCEEMIGSGEIFDSKTILAIFAYVGMKR